MVGRLGFGVAIGLGLGLSSMFVSEIPPIRFRGACGACMSLLLSFGDFTSLTITLPELLGTENLWPLAFALPGFPAFILLCSLPFFPETPRFAYITRNNAKLALKALHTYQGPGDKKIILDELEKERLMLLHAEKFKVIHIIVFHRLYPFFA